MEESLEYLLEARDIRAGALPEGHWFVGASELELGRSYEVLERDGEAERALSEAHRILLENFGSEDSRTEQARRALQEHYERRGMTAEAAAITEGA